MVDIQGRIRRMLIQCCSGGNNCCHHVTQVAVDTEFGNTPRARDDAALQMQRGLHKRCAARSKIAARAAARAVSLTPRFQPHVPLALTYLLLRLSGLCTDHIHT